ncbi:MAG: hypothetical protein FWD53_13405, partial [Phycisphaerales bacterium]|nr:hypothetical protein [Phycisphaerales bacterium]
NNDVMITRAGVDVLTTTWGPNMTGTKPFTGGPYINGVWVEQLAADGCVPGIRRDAPYANILQQYEFCGRGIFLCPSAMDSNFGINTTAGASVVGGPLVFFDLGYNFGSRANNGYGINPPCGSNFGVDGNGQRLPQDPTKVGQPDPDPSGGATGKNYSGTAQQLFRSSRNMISSSIIIFDAYAPGNNAQKWWPAASRDGASYGIYMRHFKAANYLFGDGHAEWSDQHHITKYRPGTTQVCLKNATIWQHIQYDGSLSPPQY